MLVTDETKRRRVRHPAATMPISASYIGTVFRQCAWAIGASPPPDSHCTKKTIDLTRLNKKRLSSGL
jgi:hypothetical protein